MKWRQELMSFLTFGKRDRLAMLLLVTLLILVWSAPKWWPAHRTIIPLSAADSAWIESAGSLKPISDSGRKYPVNSYQKNSYSRSYRQPQYPVKPTGALFPFDPNTIDEKGWQQLGLRDKTIHIIQNYIAKGGRFKEPGDLSKVYGLFPDEYERLAPFIRIETINDPIRITNHEERKVNSYVKPVIAAFDINQSDSTSWIALPGIGEKLARRIILFREKLGGFYSIEQVAETFGLADSVFQKIKNYLRLESVDLRKININDAPMETLQSHPYLRYTLAKAIVTYRTEHGKFLKPEDLLKIMAMTQIIFQKVSPYLAL